MTAPVTYGQLSVLRSVQYNSYRGDRARAEANIDVVWSLPDGVEEAQVSQAWFRLVEINEALRTVYDWHRPDPVQIVRPAETGKLDVVALTDTSRSAAETVARVLCHQAIDIEHEPPWRALLITDGSRPRHVAIALHHVAADHLAVRLLHEQFQTLLGGGSVPVRPQPRTVAAAQREHDERNQEAIAHWVGEWATFDAEDRAGQDHSLRVQAAMHSDAAARAARTLARRLGISAAAVVLGVSGIVLAALLRRGRITIGLTSSNRFDERAEALVASMAQLAPQQITVDGRSAAKDYLFDVYLGSIVAYSHATYDVDELARRLADAGVPNPDPLEFDCYFNFLEALRVSSDPAGPAATSIEWMPTFRQTGPRFSLLVGLSDDPAQGMSVILRASHDYLDPAGIAAFLGSFEAVLVALESSTDVRIADLDLTPLRPVQPRLSADELQTLVTSVPEMPR